MKEHSEGLEIVMMVASKDGELRRTHIFNNVVDFDMQVDESPATFVNPRGRRRLRDTEPTTDISLSFTAMLDRRNDRYMVTYDHNISSRALNDLDEFLRTFPAADRLHMAKRYVEAKEHLIKEFMDQNEELAIEYLTRQGYSITSEEDDDCDCEDHCVC